MSEEKSLNRQIAEALGYTVKRLHNEPSPVYVVSARDFVLYSPNGDLMQHGQPLRDGGFDAATVDKAWMNSPDYEHSIDAIAAELPTDYKLKLSRHYAVILNENSTKAWSSNVKSHKPRDMKQSAAYALLAYAEDTNWRAEQPPPPADR